MRSFSSPSSYHAHSKAFTEEKGLIAALALRHPKASFSANRKALAKKESSAQRLKLAQPKTLREAPSSLGGLELTGMGWGPNITAE